MDDGYYVVDMHEWRLLLLLNNIVFFYGKEYARACTMMKMMYYIVLVKAVHTWMEHGLSHHRTRVKMSPRNHEVAV